MYATFKPFYYEQQSRVERDVWGLASDTWNEKAAALKEIPILYFREDGDTLMLLTGMHYPAYELHIFNSKIPPSDKSIWIFINEAYDLPKDIIDFIDELKRRGRQNKNPILIDMELFKVQNSDKKDYPFTLRTRLSCARIKVHPYVPVNNENLDRFLHLETSC